MADPYKRNITLMISLDQRTFFCVSSLFSSDIEYLIQIIAQRWYILLIKSNSSKLLRVDNNAIYIF